MRERAHTSQDTYSLPRYRPVHRAFRISKGLKRQSLTGPVTHHDEMALTVKLANPNLHLRVWAMAMAATPPPSMMTSGRAMASNK